MKKLFDSFVPAVLLLVLVLWGGLTYYYRTGAAGVSFGPGGGHGSLSFGREHDFLLLRIDDHKALEVSASHSFAVVNYERAAVPICWLCGTYEEVGRASSEITHLHGDWLYSGAPTVGLATAINVRTGEALVSGLDIGDWGPGLAARPFYRDHGFTLAADEQLTEARIAELLPALSTLNESCEMFNYAFLLMVGALLIAWPITVLRRRRAVV